MLFPTCWLCGLPDSRFAHLPPFMQASMHAPQLREISLLDNPRSTGRALVGNLAGLWRNQVGDYRIICEIEDGVLLILVVDVAHRSEVYKRRR